MAQTQRLNLGFVWTNVARGFRYKVDSVHIGMVAVFE